MHSKRSLKPSSPFSIVYCEVPFRLRRFQYIDFRTDYNHGLEELLKILQAYPAVGKYRQRTRSRRSPVVLHALRVRYRLGLREWEQRAGAVRQLAFPATRSAFPSWGKYATLGAVILVAAVVLYFMSSGTPSITSIVPRSGPPGTVVTLSGKNFGATQGGSTVKFGNATAAVSSWSGTSSLVTVPKVAIGPANVVVSVNNKDSAPASFTVSSAPGATSLSPASGPPGTPVTISGVNFGATQGNSTVRFGSVTAPITYWSENSIAATVPNLRQGPENAVVSVNGVDSAPLRFNVSGGGHSGNNEKEPVSAKPVNSAEYQRVKDHLMQTQAQAQAVLGQWNRTAAEVARNGGSLRSDEQTALNLLRRSMDSASRSLQTGDLATAIHSLDTADQQMKLLQQYAE